MTTGRINQIAIVASSSDLGRPSTNLGSQRPGESPDSTSERTSVACTLKKPTGASSYADQP